MLKHMATLRAFHSEMTIQQYLHFIKVSFCLWLEIDHVRLGTICSKTIMCPPAHLILTRKLSNEKFWSY